MAERVVVMCVLYTHTLIHTYIIVMCVCLCIGMWACMHALWAQGGGGGVREFCYGYQCTIPPPPPFFFFFADPLYMPDCHCDWSVVAGAGGDGDGGEARSCVLPILSADHHSMHTWRGGGWHRWRQYQVLPQGWADDPCGHCLTDPWTFLQALWYVVSLLFICIVQSNLFCGSFNSLWPNNMPTYQWFQTILSMLYSRDILFWSRTLDMLSYFRNIRFHSNRTCELVRSCCWKCATIFSVVP